MKAEREKVQSLERALKILECFTMETPELFLGEISAKSKLSKSTVHRLLGTMLFYGYINQNEDNQKYSLGLKLFRLGSIVRGNLSLRGVALSYMNQLCGEISETVGLNIVDEEYRVCIESVESVEVVRSFIKVGQRVPLCQGASSMVLLSFMPEHRKCRIVDQGEKDGLLLMPKSKLMECLEQIARLKYWTSVNDRVQGAFSVSAPIFNHTDDLVASLTAAGPVQRLTDDRLQLMITKVTQSADRISEALGHSGMMAGARG